MLSERVWRVGDFCVEINFANAICSRTSSERTNDLNVLAERNFAFYCYNIFVLNYLRFCADHLYN